jgi:predicted DNA-binding antitoxin AbrB/MazE fold protein
VRGTPQHIRARYSQGVLVLAEPLDLPEGSEVEIQISTAKKS